MEPSPEFQPKKSLHLKERYQLQFLKMTYPWESILSVLEGQRKLIKVDDKKQITGTFAVMERFKGHGNDI